MHIDVIGYERVQYKKSNGQDVSGYNIHYTSPIDSNRGKGVACNSVYVSDTRIQGKVDLLPADLSWGRSRNGQAFVDALIF